MNVAIVGGSIAGCAAAIELLRAGHAVTVYERSKGPLQGRGAGIGTPTRTLETLVARDLTGSDMPRFVASDHPLAGRTSEREPLGHIALTLPLDMALCNWGDLFSELRDRVPDEAYRSGLGVDSVSTDDPHRPVLQLDDGAEHPASSSDDRTATAAEMAAGLEELAAGATPASGSIVRPLPDPASAASIAVLPFTNMSSDKDQDHFCEGMAEDILNALTKVDGLRVVARTSSFQFAGKSHDVGHIGRALKVDQILEGSVRSSGDRLRVTAQLIRVHDSSHVWSERYDREKEDVFAIQDEISEQIVEALRIRLVGDGKAEPGKRHTDDVEAYHLYLKGQHNWYRREGDSLQKAADFFEEAARRDPAYTLAHVGLANAYSSLGFYGMEPATARKQAEAAVDRALTLDADLAEVHAARGLMQNWLLWDWDGAERSFRASIARNPEYILVRCWYSFLLDSRDRPEEALSMAESALALDPLAPYVNTCLALNMIAQGMYSEATEALGRALEMEPDFLYTLWVLGGTHALSGRHDEAVSVLDKAATLSGRAPYYLGWLAFACGRAGRRERATGIIEELSERARTEYVAPPFFAWAYSGLGETKKALDWAEKACEEKSPPMVMHQGTLLGDLRSEPRFQDVRRRMKLEP